MRVAAVVAGSVVALLLGASGASARDSQVTSFDGTVIKLHFFPAAKAGPGGKQPTVLYGPGWSQPGVTDPDSKTTVTSGAIGVGPLRAAGYNVLTWDPRGFGSSGGNAMVDSPDFEGRDVEALIDYVAKQPEALLDKPGDPRVGMTGASYGGGIQLVTAAIDPRVDVIVPDIAWHSLTTALFKDRTVKTGWSSILYSLGSALGHLDPHIGDAYMQGLATGTLPPDDEQFFATRGPGDLVKRITIPTLLIQGTVDTLFTLDEATTNYAILRSNGVPAKMLWFCGGHGACITDPGDTSRIEKDTLTWLKRYLDKDTSVDTGPRFEWLDQNGASFHANDYPVPAGTAKIAADGSGTLALTTAGGSGPVVGASPGDVIATLAAPVAAAKAANAVNVTIPAPSSPQQIVGAPTVDLTYTATGVDPTNTTRVFGQIVDDATGKVLGNQITPIPVVLDGQPHTVSRPLEIVAATAKPGSTFTLQLVASTTAYNLQRAAGDVVFSKIHVSLPVVDVAKGQETENPTKPPVACTSKRAITLNAPRSTRSKVVSVTAFIGNTKLASAKGSRVKIDLAGRPAGAVTVKLVMHVAGGGTKTSTRHYRLCKAGTKHG